MSIKVRIWYPNTLILEAWKVINILKAQMQASGLFVISSY